MKCVSVGDVFNTFRETQIIAGTAKSLNVGLGLVVRGQLDKETTILDQIIAFNPANIWLSSDAVVVLDEVDFTNYCRFLSKSFDDYG
jgi:hypothetical protein